MKQSYFVIPVFVFAVISGSIPIDASVQTSTDTAVKRISATNPQYVKKAVRDRSRMEKSKSGLHSPAKSPFAADVLQPPKRMTTSGSSIYGYCTFATNDEYVNAMCELMPSGVDVLWSDFNYWGSEIDPKGGFLKDGDLYAFTEQYEISIEDGVWNIIQKISFDQYDFTTGNILSRHSLPLETAPSFSILTYNPSEDCIYGYGLMPGYDSEVFMKVPFADPAHPEMIRILDEEEARVTAICYNVIDNNLYGVTTDKEFVCIYEDGSVKPLFTIDENYSPEYYSSIVYCVPENVFYWNMQTYDGAYMTTIDMSARKTDPYLELEYGNSFSFLITTDLTIPDAPGKAEIESFSFPEGSLDGSIVYRLPSKLNNGDPIAPGDRMDYIALVDGVGVDLGEGVASQEVTLSYRNLEEGVHVFSFKVLLNGKESPANNKIAFIGKDTPCAPTNVVLSDDELVWEPVTKSENNGYVDYTDITYNVSINGEFYTTTKDSRTIVNLPDDHTLTLYTASVTAEYAGKTSSSTESNTISYGRPYNIPFVIEPTNEQAALCAIVDRNSDGVSWTYIEDYFFSMGYSQDGVRNDDWLFLPPFTVMDTNRFYNFEFDTTIANPMFPDEYLEVWIGEKPQPEAMTRCVVQRRHLRDDLTDFEKIRGLFNVEKVGTYYIGICCSSEPNQAGLYVKNIVVTDNNITTDSPAAVSEVSVEAADKGILSATISFTLPINDMVGKVLDSKELSVTITSGKETKTVKGLPGQHITTEITTDQGNNTIAITASDFDNNSPTVYIEVYTGIAFPVAPVITSTRTGADNMSINFSWDAVTKGVNGGFIRPENVTYNVYRYMNYGFYDEFIPVATDLRDTSYTYRLEEEEGGVPQEYITVTVCAVNEAGQGEMIAVGDILGTPYELPFFDDFEDGFFAHEPWLLYGPDQSYYNSTCELLLMATVNDTWPNAMNTAIVASGPQGSKSMLGTPRISTIGKDKVILSLELYSGENAAPLRILGNSYTGAIVEIGSFVLDGTREFSTVTFDLPSSLINKNWIQLYFDSDFNRSGLYTVIDYMSLSRYSGIDEIDNNEKPLVVGMNGYISIESVPGSSITIAGIDGTLYWSASDSKGSEEIPVEKGIYIVSIDGKSSKVVVR